MEDGEREGGVAGEVVQAEIVEAAVRPLADRAVAESHQGAEEHVEGDGSYGGEADVSGEVQDGDVGGHWGVGRGGGEKGNERTERRNGWIRTRDLRLANLFRGLAGRWKNAARPPPPQTAYGVRG